MIAVTARALSVFIQNDGAVTKAYYADLSALGPIGLIAMNLFRAQKRSSRAKEYRRGKYRALAYDVKQYSISELCKALTLHGSALGFKWGWKQDANVVFGGDPSFVLYCELPDNRGQVSFHSPARDMGPDYAGSWDGLHLSQARIIQFCDSLF
jgi:hypothetical protein